MEELIGRAVEAAKAPFNSTRSSELPSLRSVAEHLGTTVIRTRKLLITAGYFESPTAQSVQRLKAEGRTIEEIGAALRLKPAAVYPSHYTTGKIEVIDFIEDQKLPMHLGNAVKYICRAGKKDPAKTKEDLEKAIWYMRRYVDYQHIGTIIAVIRALILLPHALPFLFLIEMMAC